MPFVLRDGRRAVVRPIRRSDRERLVRGLEGLSARTRRLRFHGERTGFSEAELDYLTACDGSDRIAEVALGVDETGEEAVGVGVARAYRDPDEPSRAEVAIVVVDDWQGVGVGRILFAALADRCRAAGIRQWKASVLGGNAGGERLLMRMGKVVERRWRQGVQEITVELDRGPADF